MCVHADRWKPNKSAEFNEFWMLFSLVNILTIIQNTENTI